MNLVSLKCDCYDGESAACQSKMWNTFTDWVEIAFVNAKNNQDTENNVRNDEKKISNAEKSKEMVEDTFHAALAKNHKTEEISHYKQSLIIFSIEFTYQYQRIQWTVLKCQSTKFQPPRETHKKFAFNWYLQ